MAKVYQSVPGNPNAPPSVVEVTDELFQQLADLSAKQYLDANPDIDYPISPNTGKPLRAFQVVDTVNIVDSTTKDGQRIEKIIDLSDLQKNIKQKGIEDYSKFWKISDLDEADRVNLEIDLQAMIPISQLTVKYGLPHNQIQSYCDYKGFKRRTISK